MIELASRFINLLIRNIFYDYFDEEVSYADAVKLESKYYTVCSFADIDREYKKPRIGQKFLCITESKLYVYIGGRKFVYIDNAYI